MYAEGSKKNLNMLDKLQNVALRIITDGRRSDPILFLEVEVNLHSLILKRKLVVYKHMIKLLYRPKGTSATAILGLDDGKLIQQIHLCSEPRDI